MPLNLRELRGTYGKSEIGIKCLAADPSGDTDFLTNFAFFSQKKFLLNPLLLK